MTEEWAVNTEVRGILRAYVLIVTMILCASAVASAAVIITEQQKRTPPVSVEELIEGAMKWVLGKDKE